MSKNDYYSEAAHGPHDIFELGNYQLESGITLPNARIAYKRHGTLNAAKDNLITHKPQPVSATGKALELFGHWPSKGVAL
jgi:homoserine O-acetyltransferase